MDEIATVNVDPEEAFGKGHDDLVGKYVRYRSDTWLVKHTSVGWRRGSGTTVTLTLLRSGIPEGFEVSATLD